LQARLGEVLTTKAQLREFVLPAGEGRKIAWLHAHGEVLEDEETGDGEGGPQRRLLVRLNPKELGQFATL
jgi:GTPase